MVLLDPPHTGLRISDVVSVQVHNLISEQNNFKDYFILNEKKTGKFKKIKINDGLRKALKSFMRKNDLTNEDYIFKSRKQVYKSHISVTQAYRILKAGAQAVGIENFGTHSLRKTWGFWTYDKSKYNIALIMSIFNHSSQNITLRYIGIDQKSQNELYSLVQFQTKTYDYIYFNIKS